LEKSYKELVLSVYPDAHIKISFQTIDLFCDYSERQLLWWIYDPQKNSPISINDQEFLWAAGWEQCQRRLLRKLEE
jgi:hypothetical protein